MSPQPRRFALRPNWYWWAAMLLSSLTTSAIALTVALKVNAESDRKWCTVVTVMDDAYRETPPTTAAGRNFAEAIADLRRSLDCPPRQGP